MVGTSIEICDTNGRKLYRATVAVRIGEFAIHRVKGWEDHGWNVTHIGSKYAAVKLVKRKREAERFARWLMRRGAELGVDWGSDTFDELRAAERWGTLAAEARERAEKFAHWGNA